MNKKGFEMSFSWLFAIIVGAIILFLAISSISKISDNQTYTNNIKTSSTIDVLANKFELGYESSAVSKIKLPSDSKLDLECNNNPPFGKQKLIVDSEFFDKWSDTGNGVSSENKYFFFDRPLEAREMIVFSKVFEFPFKVATLNYFIPASEQYCFVEPIPEVVDELEKNNISNFELQDSLEECSSEAKTICFQDDEDCDIFVSNMKGYVFKGSYRVSYGNVALMFAAIFSDQKTYECQLSRLMSRTNSLAEIYLEKIDMDSIQGCNSNQKAPLDQLILGISEMEDSDDLQNLIPAVTILERNSRGGGCALW